MKIDPNIDIRPAADKYPALYRLACQCADIACREINATAPTLDAPGMPYKQQCTLELLIEELRKRV